MCGLPVEAYLCRVSGVPGPGGRGTSQVTALHASKNAGASAIAELTALGEAAWSQQWAVALTLTLLEWNECGSCRFPVGGAAVDAGGRSRLLTARALQVVEKL